MADLGALAQSLSEIERAALKALSAGEAFSVKELAGKSGLNPDSVRRALGWLLEKKLVDGEEKKEKQWSLTEKGVIAVEKGLPEKRMLSTLMKGNDSSFNGVMKSAGLTQEEFSAALGQNKAKAFVLVSKKGNAPSLELTEVGKEFAGKENPEEGALKKISEKDFSFSEEESKALELLKKRNFALEKELVERKAKINAEGLKALELLPEKKTARAYNIFGPVPKKPIGKRQPYIQFLSLIRRKLVELGFQEMPAPLIVHEFYNFDVLFQPQNHPARSWSDTYQLKQPQRAKLLDRGKVKAVKAAHETGGVSASSGWQYDWLEEVAERLMPAAHGTAHSARTLTQKIEVPGKYFAIARCFRPDVLDATHLIEFNQTEGFIIGEDLNFRHLLGMLEQFAKEIAGADKVKFLPDYYPFTEPSCQISAKHPELGWMELGGSGIFRPEMMENLGYKKEKAIAWGIGIDRLAMFKLGIKDIRQLFSDDLNWLRAARMVE
ncbi:MAG: phenylalanine--tRNA ligase subunit alpha [Candidatus Diapherotrites archaeon]